jgi:hypothetical protein
MGQQTFERQTGHRSERVLDPSPCCLQRAVARRADPAAQRLGAARRPANGLNVSGENHLTGETSRLPPVVYPWRRHSSSCATSLASAY